MSKFGGVPAQDYDTKQNGVGGPEQPRGSRFGGLALPPDLMDTRSVWETSGANELPSIRRATNDLSSARDRAMSGVPASSPNHGGLTGLILKDAGGPPKPAKPSHRAPGQQTYGEYLSNIAGSGITGFNERLTGLPGDIIDASSWLSRNTIAPAIDYFAGTNYADQVAGTPSVGQAMRDDVAKVIPRTSPTSREAQYAQAFGQGAADASMMGMGGAMVRGAKGILGATGEFVAPKASRDILTTLTSGGGAASGTEILGDVGQAYGGDRGEMYGRFIGGIGGGLLGGVLPDRLLTSATKPTVKAPTLDGLRALKDRAYQQAESAGVVYTQDALKRLAQDAETMLASRAYRPAIHPGISRALSEINADAAKGPTTLAGMDTLRQVVRDAVTGPSVARSEKAMGAKIIAMIDDTIANARPGDVMMGDAKRGASAIAEARSLNRRLMAGERVDRMTKSAEMRAARTGSGGNVQNAIRQEFGKTIDPLYPYRAEGFLPAERAAMEKIVRGSKGQNLLRAVGAMGPSGNGLGLMLHGGAALGSGGWTLPLSAASALAKHAAEGMTRRQADRLGEMIRSGATSAPKRGLISPPQVPRGVATGLLSQAVPQVGSQMSQAFAQGDAIDKATMAIAPVPLIGDIASVANDTRHYASGSLPLTWQNLALTGLGATALGVGAFAPKSMIMPDPNSFGMFGGNLAAKADKAKMQEAARAIESGAKAEDVWKRTGWYQGVDGKLRFEIDDSAAKLTVPKNPDASVAHNLSDVLDHEKLFENYPALRDTKVIFAQDMAANSLGSFDPTTGVITVNAKMPVENQLSTILHEIQHNVQKTEGFASGGNPITAGMTIPNDVRAGLDSQGIPVEMSQQFREMAKRSLDEAKSAGVSVSDWEKQNPAFAQIMKANPSGTPNAVAREMFSRYKAIPGEAEARNTQVRAGMTAAERAQSFPDSTMDVPRNEQFRLPDDPFIGTKEGAATVNITKYADTLKTLPGGTGVAKGPQGRAYFTIEKDEFLTPVVRVAVAANSTIDEQAYRQLARIYAADNGLRVREFDITVKPVASKSAVSGVEKSSEFAKLVASERRKISAKNTVLPAATGVAAIAAGRFLAQAASQQPPKKEQKPRKFGLLNMSGAYD